MKASSKRTPQSLLGRLSTLLGVDRKQAVNKMPKKGLADMAGYVFQSYISQPGKPVWMNRNYARFADEAYVKNVIAHRAIALVAEGAASVPLKLFSNGPRGGRKELLSHPALSLLKKPNPMQGGAEFFYNIFAYRSIAGNAYVQAVGPDAEAPLELYTLRPDQVAVIAGRDGVPSGYRYTVGNKHQDFPVDRLTGMSRVLHVKTFHPLDEWYGMSPIEAAAYSIDQHNHASSWNQALLQNGARPSGALVVKASEQGISGSLSDEQYWRVKQQIDEQFSGPANAGRPILLEGGLDWREMSLSPKDMDFINAKHSSARDIALAFGVPPQLLGIPGDNTYSNLMEARLALWEQTILPALDNVVDALNGWLLPMYGAGLELAPDTDAVTALTPRRDALWARIATADFLSAEEKRRILGV